MASSKVCKLLFYLECRINPSKCLQFKSKSKYERILSFNYGHVGKNIGLRNRETWDNDELENR